MDKHDDHVHQQFFVNITASIVIDISSHVFVDKSIQLGTIIFGSLFELYSSHPPCKE